MDSAMDGLAASLRAHISEDERLAKAVEPLGYTTDMGGTRLGDKFSHARVRFASEDGRAYTEWDRAASAHFDHHDPGRELREAAVKREILALCEAEIDETDYHPLAARIMHLLASVYESSEGSQR